MKIAGWIGAVVCWCLLLAAPCRADGGSEMPIDEPMPVVPAVYENDEPPMPEPLLGGAPSNNASAEQTPDELDAALRMADKRANDVPAESAPARETRLAAKEGDSGLDQLPAPNGGDGHDAASGQPCQCPKCAPQQPLSLQSMLPPLAGLQAHNIRLGGWLEQGITWNDWYPSNRFNGPVGCNDRANEYQLNQFWVFMERPVKTDGCGWDLGGRVDMSYGTDWRFGKNVGLEDRINSANQFYGLVIPQFYLAAGVNDLTVKLGHYATGFGYENVPAVANFFYSHSYAMAYTEPLLVTGVQADYKLNDQWTLSGGFNRGWMMFEDVNSDLDFLGGVRWVSACQRTNVSFMLVTGDEDAAGQHNTFAYSLVLSQKLTEAMTYVIQHNLGQDMGGNPRTGGKAEWYDVCQYLFYTINPNWSAGLRGEWLRDNDGSRVKGVGGWIQSNKGWGAPPGFVGDFYEISAGLNWKPHPNLLFRPEMRWDWYNGSRNLAGELPFNDGQVSAQVLAAADLILLF